MKYFIKIVSSFLASWLFNGATHVDCMYCVTACIAGRTKTLKVCETAENSSRSVQQLCITHARNRPVEHWVTFLQKLEEAGMKPSSQLVMKINAWLKLWMKASYKSSVDSGEQCATTGCYQQSFGSLAVCWSCLHARQPAHSQKCRISSCHNLSLTCFGFCLVCCVVDLESRYSIIASLAASQPGRQTITCMNRDCMEYLPGATEFCTECQLQVHSEAGTSRRWKTVRGMKVHDGECDSNEPDHSVERTSQRSTVYSAKPRRSLFSSELSLSNGNVGSAHQSSHPVTACIGPLCLNKGLDKYRGLCAACYRVLATVNSQQHQIYPSYGL